MDVIAIASNV